MQRNLKIGARKNEGRPKTGVKLLKQFRRLGYRALAAALAVLVAAGLLPALAFTGVSADMIPMSTEFLTATFDGVDIDDNPGETDSRSYGHEDIYSNAKLLNIDAKFTASLPNDSLVVTDRKLTVTLKPGFKFTALPGFKWQNSTWVFDKSSLTTTMQNAIASASFEQDEISLPNNTDSTYTGVTSGKWKTQSGTVTYLFSDNNVSQIEIDGFGIVQNDAFMAYTGDAARVWNDPLIVTTSEKRIDNTGDTPQEQTVETAHQTLERIEVTGNTNLFVFGGGVGSDILLSKDNPTFAIPVFLLNQHLGFTNTAARPNTPVLIDEAQFRITVPVGFTPDPNEFVTSPFFSAGGFSVEFEEAKPDGSCTYIVTLSEVLIPSYSANAAPSLYLNLSIDEETGDSTSSLGVAAISVTSYGDSVEGVAGMNSSWGWKLIIRAQEPYLTLASTPNWLSGLGVGYVPNVAYERGESAILGSLNLINNNATATGLQTIRLEFDGAGVYPTQLRLPVGTDKKIPHLKVVTNTGRPIVQENFATGYSEWDGSIGARVVFDISEYGAAHNEWIKSIEFETEKLPSNYGRAGAQEYVGAQTLAAFGWFAEPGADGSIPASLSWDAKIIAGSSIADINGDWDTPSWQSTISTPIGNKPNFPFLISSSNINASSVLKAGSLYTVNASLAGSYASGSSASWQATSYLRGVDIYLREGADFIIDPDSIKVGGVAVEASSITQTLDKDGNLVYKIHLPDLSLGDGGGRNGASIAASLAYSLTVKTDVATGTRGLSSLFGVKQAVAQVGSEGLDDNGFSQYNPKAYESSSNTIGSNTPDVYDLDRDGNVSELQGSLSSATYLVQAQATFVAATAARQIAGSVTGDWKTASSASDAIKLAPFGSIEYRFRAQNYSGKTSGDYIVHIPIPREGQGDASGFPRGSGTGSAQFGWSAALTGPVTAPAGLNVVVLYSMDYKADTTDTTGFYPADQITDFGDVRTVRIAYSGDMLNGTIHDFILPLIVDGTDDQKLAWTNTGATNFYRATITYRLDKVTHTNIPSQPVAMALDSGIMMGRVYKDVDHNGAYGTGDSPLASVMVSPTVTAGPSFVANGSVPKVLAPVSTNAKGYYLLNLASGDEVSLTFYNPEFMTKMLRFVGDTSVANTKTTTATATDHVSVLAGGSVGLCAPYHVSWNDNRPAGGGANATWADALRYDGEPLSGTHEVADSSAVPPVASAVTGWTFSKWYTNTTGTGGSESTNYTVTDDVTFYALRTQNSYTVVYDLNGASSPASVANKTGVHWGDNGLLPSVAVTKDGYSLTWDVVTGGSGTGVTATHRYSDLADPSQGSMASGGTITLKAQWTANPAGVTFYNNYNAGDTSVYLSDSNYSVDDTITEPPAPVRDGYTFSGWYENRDGTDAWSFGTDTIPTSGTIALYAKWTGNAATVNFYYNYNSSDNSTYTAGSTINPGKRVGDTLVAPTAPTRTGYTFAGWYKERAGTNAWSFDTDIVPTTAAANLYAKWTADTYTVSFDKVASDATAPDPASTVVTYGSTYGTLPAPTRIGYALDGWYTAAISGDKIETTTQVTSTANHTLYAHWTGNAATVAFYNNYYYIADEDPTNDDNTPYDAGSAANSTKRVGDTLVVPTPPARTGYDFAGWFTDRAGLLSWNFSNYTVPPSGSVELYAKWTPTVQALALNPNGGTGGTASIQVTYGAAVGTLPAAGTGAPTRTGYDFLGWSTEPGTKTTGATDNAADFDATSVVNWTSSKTVYARWSPAEQTLNFNANGGATTPNPKQVTYDAAVGTLPSTGAGAPTRTGYDFAGWSTEAGTKTTGTTDNPDDFSAATVVNWIGSQTVYARWTAKSYTLSFSANGGVGNPTSLSVTYDSAVGTLPSTGAGTAPTRTGYDFAGWSTVQGGSVDFTSATIYRQTTSITVYAVWTASGNTPYVVEHYKVGADGVAERDDAATQSLTGATNATAQATPKTDYTGYSHAPGYSSGADVEKASGPIAADGSLILRLYYPINRHSVTYTFEAGANGIPSGAPQPPATQANVAYGSQRSVATDSMTLAGWQFSGWTTSDATLVGPAFVMPDKDVAFVGHWTANTYTVSYAVPQGVTPISDKVGVHWWDTSLLPAVPERTGYDLAGWNVKAGGNGNANNMGITAALSYGDLASSSQANASGGALTLEAQWTPKSYTLSFDKNAADAIAGSVPSKTVTFDAPIGALPASGSVEAPTRVGYALAGWSTTSSGAVDIVATDSCAWVSNTTAYAVWNANGNTPYTVEHYLVGADGAVASPAQDIDDLSGATDTTAYATPKAYTGYTYNASYTDAQVSGRIAGDGSLVLKLYYVVNRHDVTYRVTGSVPAGAPSAPASAFNVAYKTQVSVAKPLVYAGYTFSGWTTSDVTVSGDSFVMPADGNVAFTGYWTAVGGGGTGGGGTGGTGGGGDTGGTGGGKTGDDATNDDSNVNDDGRDNGLDKAPDANTENPKPGSTSSTPGTSTTVVTPGTSTTQEVFSETERAQIEAQTGNPLVDLVNGNLPLGALNITGAWSLASMLLALIAFIVALIQGIVLLAGRQREGAAFGLALAVCAAGAMVPMVWLAFDRLNGPIVWFNSWTPMVAVALILQIVALVISLVSALRTARANAYLDSLLSPKAGG
jgi:uncharacterized repeat protein (TIGR02543 family)